MPAGRQGHTSIYYYTRFICLPRPRWFMSAIVFAQLHMVTLRLGLLCGAAGTNKSEILFIFLSQTRRDLAWSRQIRRSCGCKGIDDPCGENNSFLHFSIHQQMIMACMMLKFSLIVVSWAAFLSLLRWRAVTYEKQPSMIISTSSVGWAKNRP